MNDMTFMLGGELSINRLGYGALQFTGRGGWGMSTDPDTARRVLRRAVELGVNFIDTSDAYGPYVNEQVIADALHPYPPEFLIATKGGFERPGPQDWIHNGSPRHLRAALEGSLKRLKLERVELYQLHEPDPRVPIEESVGALANLQREGKIRFIGLSNVTASELKRAQRIATITSVQNRYNLADRSSEDVLNECEHADMAFIPFHPLATSRKVARKLEDVARELGATPAQVSIAWLLHRSPNILLIPGTSSLAHLEENMAACRITMRPEDIEAFN